MRDLFYGMLRVRLVEESIADRYSEQEMRCPVHLCIGQEAIAVGVCASLERRDWVMSGHRSHGHYLAKGGDLKAMLAELHGRATGCSGGKGGSMHLVDLSAGFFGATPIVGSTIPIAVGTAFGSVQRGESRVAVVFFGEGATEEGVFHESLNFAALKGLPVVFVCENNLYSVYSPMAVRQPDGRDVVRLAEAHGVESHAADGNDVVGVHEFSGRAIAKARGGGGPTFLEFATYRWREHCGPNYDNDLGYRTAQEFDEWKTRCPIERLRHELLRREVLADWEIENMVKAIQGEIEAAFAFARESPYPSAQRLLDDTYAG